MSYKKIILFLVVTILALFGVSSVLVKSNKPDDVSVNQKTDKTKIVLDSTSHNWGEIPINGGVVTKEFKISNKGSEALVLSNIKTSCMCTTAYLIKDGKKSPLFGMHTKSNYTLKIDPNETATLKVIFDPAYHGPNGIGAITRMVTIDTNDINQPSLNFTLTAMVRSK